MKRALAFVLISIFTLPLMAQDKEAEKWRNKNWNPKKGKYFFNKVYTWEYINDMAEFEEERRGEFSIYVDEKSGTFLFTPESYAFSGPMTDFVIGNKDGSYIAGYTEEFGEKVYEIYRPEAYKEISETQDTVMVRFNEFMNKTGKQSAFGDNNYGWETFTGDEYLMLFPEMPEDTTFFYLSEIPYSILPIYMFNELDIEAKLPYPYGYGAFLTSNKMVLKEYRFYQGWTNEVRLKSFSPTEYYIDLKPYKRINN